KPTYPRGWFHFIDFSDLKNPKEVARYQVPEAGTHNMWVEDDIMYAAYYNGGLRVVDISGDLMGDLYKQGREMAFFLPTDVEGYIPNAPMVWGPQPHKGHIFFSDWNTGLWAVKMSD
ncbi:MAG: LVIVD repeat-containing protein, partial [Planctomycetaceae bacterium]